MNHTPLSKSRFPGSRLSPEEERYFLLSFFLVIVGNQLPYQGARLLMRGQPHHDLTLPIDGAVPFLPWTIVIYGGCMIFWFFLYRRVAALPRRTADRFFCANLLGKLCCFLIFLFFPTTMTRPSPDGASFWDACLRLLYRIDDPTNLFPSLHCFLAWLCWAGVRRNEKVSALWRASAFLMAAAVCFSTLSTRQHVLMDVAGGVLLGELCWLLAGFDRVRRPYTALLDRLLSGGREKEDQSPT